MKCQHSEFEVKADIRPLPGGTDKPARLLELTVRCQQCGQAYELSTLGNIADETGRFQTLIHPNDTPPPSLQSVKGWTRTKEGNA